MSFTNWFRSPLKERVIDLNQYRCVPWQQRLLAVLGYALNTYAFWAVGEWMLFMLGFVLLWALCMNPALRTPNFLRFHWMQGFLWFFAWMLISELLVQLYALVQAVLAFVPAALLLFQSLHVTYYLLIAVIAAKLLGILFVSVTALRGQQTPLLGPIGSLAQRLAHR